MRKTIGVLIDFIDHLSRGYEFELREAFDAACSEHDINLLILAGRPVENPDPWDAAHNSIFELSRAAGVDGVVFASACLAHHSGSAGVERFAVHFRGVPTCSLGLELPDVPSVVLDNRSGMETLVEHIVGEHGCRRVAFLAGPQANPDSELRLAVFREVMQRHELEVDPGLLRYTDFTYGFGKRAVEELLRAGDVFDAVIAANDGLGIGAADALRANNLRVPLNVRVTGFDDLAMSRLGDPPLSTVRQPLREMARASLELVLRQIAGENVPLCTTLPAVFIPRESCGCGSYGMRTASLPPLELSRQSAEFVQDNRVRLLRLLGTTQRSAGSAHTPRSMQLLRCLESELNGERLAFIAGIESLLVAAGDDSEVFEDLQRVVTVLREELRALNDPQLEELWHEARTQISLLNTHFQMRQRMHLEDMYDRLLTTGERFSTNLELGSLRRALVEELPAAHVHNALVALYADATHGKLKSFLCLRDGAELEAEPEPYPAAQLFPSGAISSERRYTWIGLALTFESERLGVMLFEYSPSIVAYEMFRDRISLALKTADMHREIVRQTAEQERSTQEKLAAAERLQSLSVLAGGVAHDLNNALGPLAALPDVILQELGALRLEESESQREISSDLMTIKAAALRAAQTIKDLLTLGRQRQVSKETLDLNQLALNSAVVFPREALHSQGSDVQLMVRLAKEPLYVHGSEAHLLRAITNLLRNAAEAVTSKGNVVLRTFSLGLGEALAGYERVEPGSYAVVSVSDMGQGIPPEALRRIFEPFFSAKKLHHSSGSGLGLAIVHGVVKEHSGFINVESTLGRSTTFTLYFPRVSQTMKPLAPRVFVPQRGHGKILVLDDEPMQLRTASRILSRAGYQVTTAETANRACQLIGSPTDSSDAADASRSPFDLVILDMILHDEEDGLEVFDRIRKLFPTQKGILVSGHAPMERGSLALERGMAWLSKPYAADALIQVVQTTLASTGPASTPADLGKLHQDQTVARSVDGDSSSDGPPPVH